MYASARVGLIIAYVLFYIMSSFTQRLPHFKLRRTVFVLHLYQSKNKINLFYSVSIPLVVANLLTILTII